MRQTYAFIRTLLVNPYVTLGVALLPLMVVLSSCSETASGGSGFTDVGRD